MWLAETPGPDRVDPSNLQLLAHMIMGYVRKGPSVIALEGLEYIILNNDLNKVLRFLGQLRDEIIVEGSILLISVDPRTLTERQKAIMERELEVVKE
jgi:archaellum biogenesis ATPase FlaH